jgi:hypothetical protein
VTGHKRIVTGHIRRRQGTFEEVHPVTKWTLVAEDVLPVQERQELSVAMVEARTEQVLFEVCGEEPVPSFSYCDRSQEGCRSSWLGRGQREE